MAVMAKTGGRMAILWLVLLAISSLLWTPASNETTTSPELWFEPVPGEGVEAVNVTSGVAQYRCTQGYKEVSGDHVRFWKDGAWNGSELICQRIQCGQPPTSSNMTACYNSTLVNSTVVYACDAGTWREPSSVATYVCSESGQWTPVTTDDVNLECSPYTNLLGCQTSSDFTGDAVNPLGVPCSTACLQHGFDFALERGGECRCRDSINWSFVNASLCNAACVISPQPAITSSDYAVAFRTFVGDFAANASLFDGGHDVTFGRQKECRERCFADDRKYALWANNINRCLCVDDVISDAVPWTGTLPQPHMTRIMSMLIGEDEGSMEVAGSCLDLYTAGVRTHAFYKVRNNETGVVTLTHCQFVDGTPCDAGWIGFLGSCYSLETEKRTMEGAFVACRGRNSHLLSVLSPDELTFLRELLQTSNFKFNSEPSVWFRMGFFDASGSLGGQWSDGALLRYTRWKSGDQYMPEMPTAILDSLGIFWHETSECNNHYSFCKTAPEYYGCVTVQRENFTSDVNFTDPEMTLTLCIERCRGYGVRYAAISSDHCFCFAELPPHENVTWSQCDLRCPGNRYQICGGASNGINITVYVSVPGSLPGRSCVDLELQGLYGGPYMAGNQTINCKDAVENHCPRSWLPFEDHCYKFIMATGTTNFFGVCARMGAYTVTIDSQAEKDFLNSTLADLLPMTSQAAWDDKDKWKIGNYHMSGSSVVWTSTGQTLSMEVWGGVTVGEHSNSPCFSLTPGGTLQEQKCSEGYFICERGKEFLGQRDFTGIAVEWLAETMNMHVRQCVELCRGADFAFALPGSRQCLCSNWNGSASSAQVETESCLTGVQACGDTQVADIHSVYKVDEYPVFVTNCSDLFHNGILLSGYYTIDGQRTWCSMLDNTSCQASKTKVLVVGLQGRCFHFHYQTSTLAEAQQMCADSGQVVAKVTDMADIDLFTTVHKESLAYRSEKRVGLWDGLGLGLYQWADGSLTRTQDWLSRGGSASWKSAAIFDGSSVSPGDPMEKYKCVCMETSDFLGCYAATNVSLTPALHDFSSMTLTLCKQLCIGQGQPMALVSSSSCYCVNQTDVDIYLSGYESNDNACVESCPGNFLQLCGDVTRLRLYSLDTNDTAGNCTDLYSNGILLEEEYLISNETDYASSTQTCGFFDETPCQTGWLGKDGVCYKFLTEHQSFTKAASACLGVGGHLAVPDSLSEVNFLSHFLSSLPSLSSHKLWYIGIQDVILNGRYVGAHGQFLAEELWEGADVIENGTCVALSVKTARWRRVSCSGDLPLICQRGPEILGCFSKPSAMTSALTVNSVTECVLYCQASSALYAALAGQRCICMNSTEGSEVTYGTCSTSCSAYISQQCGTTAGSHVTVYDIAAYNVTTLQSCDDLTQYGLAPLSRVQVVSPETGDRLTVDCANLGALYQIVDSGTYSTSDLRTGIGKLNLTSPTLHNNAWTPPAGANDSWLQVTFSQDFLLTALAVRGSMSADQAAWVTSYSLNYSLDGSSWESYNSGEQLPGNVNRATIVTSFLTSPVVVRHYRLIPSLQPITSAISVASRGQPYVSFNATSTYIGCFGEYQAGNENMTEVSDVAQCIRVCQNQNFSLAAMNTSGQCRCRDSLSGLGRLSDEACGQAGCGHLCPLHPASLYRAYDKQCGSPPKESNMTYTVTYAYQRPDFYAFGSNVTYTCPPGYRFAQSMTYTVSCRQDNQWSSLPECEILHCPSPPELGFATKDDNSTQYGSTITYMCNPGYVLPGNQLSVTSHCLENATWSALAFSQCSRRHCADPPTVQNAVMAGGSASYVFEDVVTYSCVPSSRLHDNSTSQSATCTEHGNWSDVMPCVYYECPQPYFPRNSNWTQLSETEYVFSCLPNFIFRDVGEEARSVCNETFYWNLTQDCVFHDHRSSSACKLSGSGGGGGGGGGTVLAVTRAFSLLTCASHCLSQEGCRAYHFTDDSQEDNCKLMDSIPMGPHLPGWSSFYMAQECT